jgi:hypothetical protein
MLIRKLLLWLGFVLGGIGIALMLVAAVMTHMGMSASYNLGDPTKFEFVLVPFWQIGLAVAAVGGLFLLVSRRLKNAA